MKMLVIYDISGQILGIVYGEDKELVGLKSMAIEIPNGYDVERINVDNTEDPQPVFRKLSKDGETNAE